MFNMGKSKLIETPRKKDLSVTKSIVRSRPTSTAVHNQSTANIKVVVRVRPPNDKEQGENHRNVIKFVDDKMLIFDPQEDIQPFFYHGVQQKGRDLLKRANKNMQFLFDRVFSTISTNDDVFVHSTQELIATLMDGCNCSVFVYGATGAGKTHTMLGHNKSPGITFLTMNELFKQKEQLSKERDFELAVTYLEVYNENVQDLLNPGVQLHLREDGQFGVRVQGSQIKRIEQPNELFEMLEKGNKNRTQHPTDANAESSRSHAVFQVYIQMKIKSTQQVRFAKLSMIDLAGSERGAATGCSGARFTEGANINKSLLALGNCINGLADGLRHIPYRDSKLTRLLKDSLGGNCQTVMIANISPSSLCYEDTYNTLKYANRAKKIKSSLKKNVVNCEGHVGQYVQQLEELKKERAELKSVLLTKDKEIFSLKKELQDLKCLHENQSVKRVEELKKEPDEFKYLLNLKDKEILELKREVEGLKNSIASTKSASNLVATESVHLEKQNAIKTLYEDYINIHQQLLEKQSNINLLKLQNELKMQAVERMNKYCNTPEKLKGNRRLGIAVQRLDTELNVICNEVDTLIVKENTLKEKIICLLNALPELTQISDKEELKFYQVEIKSQLNLMEQMKRITKNELNDREYICDMMYHILQPCFSILRGLEKAPQKTIKDYNTLIRHLQGISGVSWNDNSENEVPVSTADITITISEDENRAIKRKHTDEVNNMEGFVMKTKPQKYLTANEYLSKVTLSQQPRKKMAKLVSASPRIPKDNRRQVGTMGTSERFPSENNLRKLGKSLSKSADSIARRPKV